ncbi:MAG TPA: carbon monoxide dehydrogenase subunit G [Intrasporangium sp.]|uniref:SRPBCC family protein n=1 Tax=Intrasporangium sp. TaxID=1925024 RepID=UPI002D7737F6|nr:carbon monoxide dehydrogenase subunit G [Intrasporangium sp.]HET7398944.1 carbon monoxide dehydrogenase subunit G [Intrasporangium sp.]
MKITGTATLSASPRQVWEAIHDPAVLARCLPGCESLTETGPDSYAMRVTAGVAAIRGTYDGTVRLLDPQPLTALRLKAAGAGAPGTVEADVAVRLAAAPDGGTQLTYDADAAVGGPVGGVGQRMLAGVTRKLADQFFTAVDADIAGPRPAEAVGAESVDGATSGAVEPQRTPRTYAGSASPGRGQAPPWRRGAPLETAGFAAGVALGGLLALAGVALGARIARRG